MSLRNKEEPERTQALLLHTRHPVLMLLNVRNIGMDNTYPVMLQTIKISTVAMDSPPVWFATCPANTLNQDV